MISVIVPVYNVEKYINKCVESIVNQTYKDLEIILVDDGSPDNCPAMCDEWAKKDGRIKVIHKENGGVSTARNVGLENAKGDFIGFVDSDDYIASNMYEFLLNSLIVNNSDVSVCSTFLVSENNEIKSDNKVKSQLLNQEESVKYISYEMNNSLWNKLFRKDVIKDLRFEEGYTHGEDHLILLNVLKNIKKVSFVEDSLYYYVQRSNSTTGAKFNSKSFDQVYMKDALYDFVKDNFPYVSNYYRKLSFSARENMCRKIILSNSDDKYVHELNEYQEYMKKEFSAVKGNLSKKEILEYKLIFCSKSIYRYVFGKILKK